MRLFINQEDLFKIFAMKITSKNKNISMGVNIDNLSTLVS